MNIKEQIEKSLGQFISTSNVDICEYQCNAAFAMAKAQGRKPFEIAQEIANGFKSDFAEAVAHPSGFVNFKLTDKTLVNIAKNILDNKKLPLATQKTKTIFFDYLGANVAKELHIGHLRPPIIGEALRRTFNEFGHKTISYAHLGDWGLQMGLVIGQLMDDGYIENNKFVKEINLDVFNILYPKASKRSKEDPDFRSRAEDITAKLQKLEEPYYGLWKVIRATSVEKITENYLKLGCTFDAMNGESNAQPFIPETIEKLKTKGAYQSQGCLIFDVKTEDDNCPMPPVILQKPNGGDLYATTDIATILFRMREYNPNEIIYVSDFRQELHFEQVFRTVKLGGIVKPETKLTLVSHGTMNGTDGKPFKTRSGDVVKLEDVINLVTDAATKKMRNPNPVDAQKIGIAALKFADLSNSVRKDYVFDIDKFTSFEGKTGPYLLYTIARINSILKKSQMNTKDFTITSATRDIIVACIKLSDSYSTAIENYTLNNIVESAWNLANKFNLLYANETIQGNVDNLKAAELCRTALMFALDTLAIESVYEM